MKKKISTINVKLSELIDRTLTKKSSVCIDSNKELSVHNCYGLREYSEECIELLLSDGEIKIFGEKLGLKTFSNTEITVNGKITKIEFTDEL